MLLDVGWTLSSSAGMSASSSMNEPLSRLNERPACGIWKSRNAETLPDVCREDPKNDLFNYLMFIIELDFLDGAVQNESCGILSTCEGTLGRRTLQYSCKDSNTFSCLSFVLILG